MSPLEPVLRPITRARLNELAESGFGDMIKAVVDCGRRVMVVGGGISGIQAALDLASAGFKVYLVEKSPTIANPRGPSRRGPTWASK